MKYKVGDVVIMKQYMSFFNENEIYKISEVSYNSKWYSFYNKQYVADDSNIKGVAFSEYLKKL